jgi:hypothetical protein
MIKVQIHEFKTWAVTALPPYINLIQDLGVRRIKGARTDTESLN